MYKCQTRQTPPTGRWIAPCLQNRTLYISIISKELHHIPRYAPSDSLASVHQLQSHFEKRLELDMMLNVHLLLGKQSRCPNRQLFHPITSNAKITEGSMYLPFRHFPTCLLNLTSKIGWLFICSVLEAYLGWFTSLYIAPVAKREKQNTIRSWIGDFNKNPIENQEQPEENYQRVLKTYELHKWIAWKAKTAYHHCSTFCKQSLQVLHVPYKINLRYFKDSTSN